MGPWQVSEDINQKSKYVISTAMLFLACFSNVWLRSIDRRDVYLLVILTIAACALFKGITRPKRIYMAISSGFLLWALILFWMYFFYGTVLVSYRYFSVPYFSVMIITIISLLVLFIDIPEDSMMGIFINVCVISSVVVCISVCISEWSLITSGMARIGESASGNVNTLAVYLGLLSIPCIYNVIFKKKLIFCIPYAIVVVVMLMTGSKKALLYILLSTVILSLFKYGIKLHKYILPILLMLVISYLIINNVFFYEIIGKRTIDFLAMIGFNMENANYSNSTEMRLEMYRIAWEAFLHHPFFGGGWGYFYMYSGIAIYSHNNFTEILDTYGVVGFLLYYGMYLWCLAKLLKLIKHDDNAKLLMTILLVVIICDVGAVTFMTNVLSYIVLLFTYLYVTKKSLKINLYNNM